jgi:hypothetical protein
MADVKKFSVGEKVMIQGFWGMTVLVKEIPVEKPQSKKIAKSHESCLCDEWT